MSMDRVDVLERKVLNCFHRLGLSTSPEREKFQDDISKEAEMVKLFFERFRSGEEL